MSESPSMKIVQMAEILDGKALIAEVEKKDGKGNEKTLYLFFQKRIGKIGYHCQLLEEMPVIRDGNLVGQLKILGRAGEIFRTLSAIDALNKYVARYN